MFEDIDEITKVEEANLLEVLPLLVCCGRAVLLTSEQVERILCSEERVIIQDFDCRHPVGIVISRNLRSKGNALCRV